MPTQPSRSLRLRRFLKPAPFTWRRVVVFSGLLLIWLLAVTDHLPLHPQGPIGAAFGLWVVLVLFWGGPPLWRTFLPSRGGDT